MNETTDHISSKTGKQAFLLGLLGAVFFSFAYIFNNLMSNQGGSWFWTACLRYLLIFPILLVVVLVRRTLGKTLAVLKKSPGKWVLWSTVGFGGFFVPITFASAYGPSWLVSGTYQFTIFAGALLTPLFWVVKQTPQGPVRERGKIPLRLFPAFAVILIGIFLLQIEHAQNTDLSSVFLFSLPVLISAFAYPLGNRKLMELCGDQLSVIERVFAMSLCSLPFFIIIGIIAGATTGAPQMGQIVQSLIVAVASGIGGSLVFFKATQLVRRSPHWLAFVESTQSAEIPVCLVAGVLLLGNPLPGAMGAVGLVLIIVGMVFNSILQSRLSGGAEAPQKPPVLSEDATQGAP